MYPVKKRTFSDYKTSLSLSAPNNTAYFLWDEYFKALISSNSCGIKTDWIRFTFLSFEDKIVFFYRRSYTRTLCPSNHNEKKMLVRKLNIISTTARPLKSNETWKAIQKSCNHEHYLFWKSRCQRTGANNSACNWRLN